MPSRPSSVACRALAAVRECGLLPVPRLPGRDPRSSTTPGGDLRPQPPRRARFASTSEKPFENDERIAGFDEIVELRADLFLATVDQPHDFDATRRSAIGDAAGQRQCLQYGVAALDPIGTRTLHLPEHNNTGRPPHEYRVSIA